MKILYPFDGLFALKMSGRERNSSAKDVNVFRTFTFTTSLAFMKTSLEDDFKEAT